MYKKLFVAILILIGLQACHLSKKDKAENGSDNSAPATPSVNHSVNQSTNPVATVNSPKFVSSRMKPSSSNDDVSMTNIVPATAPTAVKPERHTDLNLILERKR